LPAWWLPPTLVAGADAGAPAPVLAPAAALQTTVRITAFSPTGRSLASVDLPSTSRRPPVDLPSTASTIHPQRPLIAVDGKAGVAYVATGDTLDAGTSAPIARPGDEIAATFRVG